MSVLDLQGIETAPQTDGGGRSHSGSNHDSCPSDLSAALCGHNSGLSLILC